MRFSRRGWHCGARIAPVPAIILLLEEAKELAVIHVTDADIGTVEGGDEG